MSEQGKFSQANGLNIHYKDHGEGVPLILLHGGTSTLAEWDAHIPAFSSEFHVYALDSRGHGRTVNPSDKLSYRVMADDVAAFIQSMGLDRPLICGYSDGGQIALELAIRYPGLSRGLVVGAAWYKFSDAYVDALKGWGFERPGEMDLDWLQANHADMVESWKIDHPREGDPDYWKSFINQISEMWLTPLNYTEADFKGITDPVLIIMGDRDGMIPLSDAFEMYQMIPNAELAILPNADHLDVVIHPKTFIYLVMKFFRRHDE